MDQRFPKQAGRAYNQLNTNTGSLLGKFNSVMAQEAFETLYISLIFSLITITVIPLGLFILSFFTKISELSRKGFWISHLRSAPFFIFYYFIHLLLGSLIIVSPKERIFGIVWEAIIFFFPSTYVSLLFCLCFSASICLYIFYEEAVDMGKVCEFKYFPYVSFIFLIFNFLEKQLLRPSEIDGFPIHMEVLASFILYASCFFIFSITHMFIATLMKPNKRSHVRANSEDSY